MFKRSTLLSVMLASAFTAQAGWEVTWIDRFDGDGVNWNNWTAQTQANYNNEVQCYTDDDSSANRNYDVSNGTLKIIARRMNIACPGQGGRQLEWTSGRLNSKDKGEFLYGRIETRLRFNELRQGTWPAFWALENRIQEQPIAGDNDNVNWPNRGAGEIDIWEWHGSNGNSYITAFHNTTRYGGSNACGDVQYYNYPGGASDVLEYHDYAMEWTPDEITFWVNDTLAARQDVSSCGFYEEPMFLLINVAMGGTLGGPIDPTLDTATMEVDYIARCAATDSNTATRCNESTPLAADLDNDGVVDVEDQCPNTDAGATVNLVGCAIVDSDSDGVIDADDQCPSTATGVTVNLVGCELLSAPPAPAPTPELDAANVLSLFSDAYSDIASIEYNPNWGQATVASVEEIAGGGSVLKYAGLNYQGTDFENNKQDVSGYDTLNFDYWTGDASALAMYVISPGPLENAFEITEVRLQEWVTVSVPLSHYSVPDLTDIFQLKVTGNGTVFLDNIYFARGGESDSGSGNESEGAGSGSAVGSGNEGGSGDEGGSGTDGGDSFPSVTPSNSAPVVTLEIWQNGAQVDAIDLNRGNVELRAVVVDTDADDTHNYLWTIQGASFTNNDSRIVMTPTQVIGSSIVVTLIATDNGTPALSGNYSASLPVTQVTSTTAATSSVESSGSSGGSVSWLWGLLAGVVMWRRRLK